MQYVSITAPFVHTGHVILAGLGFNIGSADGMACVGSASHSVNINIKIP